MNSINIYPQLRFSEFNDSWTKKTTKEIAPLQRGFDLPISELTAGEYPVVFSNGALKTHNKYMAKAPGVVTGRSGTIGKVTYVEMNFWPHNTALWVTDYCGNDPKYIYYFYYQFKLERLGTGSGVPTLNRNDVHSVIKYIPSLPEQHKIAAFLSAVDKKIQILQKKKELLEQYKKGLMQKIFSREIRFKDENGQDYPEWEEKRLEDMGVTYSGLNGKSGSDFGSGLPFITYKQIFDDSKIEISKFDHVIIHEGENQNIAKYGDVFFTTSSETRLEVGFSSVLLDDLSPLYLNSFCFGFRINSHDELKPEFARYLFRSEPFREMIARLSQGSTRYNLSKKEMMKLILPIPSTNEQILIATFLTKMDEKLESQSIQIDRTQQFKKGLLQQMFV